MSEPVCPWWFCFTFDNFLRRAVQNPDRILSPYIKEGWTVLDVGPGMGYFTITLARLVGRSGKVIAADLQPEMLRGIARRGQKAGVPERILLHQSTPDRIGIDRPVDFCLAFWMVHEVPQQERFLTEIAASLKPGGWLLIAEPKVHVSREDFAATVQFAEKAGLSLKENPRIFFSYTALLCRGEN